MEPRPTVRTRVLGASLVACTYAYFLLFAQFAFLRVAQYPYQPAAGVSGPLPLPLVGLQGAGGLLGAILAMFFLRPDRARWLLAGSFALGCAATLLALLADSAVAFSWAAFATGLSIGLATVVVATCLRSLAGRHLGLVAGFGTGLAYAVCSFPPLFEASPQVQSLVSGAIALLGAAGAVGLPAAGISAPFPTDDKVRVIPWFAVFAALVALDSAAFFIIQHAPALKEAAWSGEPRQFGVAFVHFAGAIVAGLLLDAGRLRLVAAVALAALATACVLMLRPAGWHSLLYATGVSLYSAALVFVPASLGNSRFAALFYIVCGWIGSGIGIGLAQDRAAIPPTLVAACGALAVAGLLLPRKVSPIW